MKRSACLLALLSPLLAAAGRVTDFAPSFAVELADGRRQEFHPRDQGEYSFAADGIEAAVTRQSDGRWLLKLRNRSANLVGVWFPLVLRKPLGALERDDILYYPHHFGAAKRADATMYVGKQQTEAAWYGHSYPGPVFAPLLVLADDTQAVSVAAANWPPIPLSPRFSVDRFGLRYADSPAQGQERHYFALCTQVSDWPAEGLPAWARACDAYKGWLRDRMRESGLDRPLPEAARHVNGWLHVALQNRRRVTPDEMLELWRGAGRRLGWMQCWGQMSNFHGPPGVRDSRGAVPPLKPGEDVGCCLDQPEIHPRYRAFLPAVARQVVDSGGLFGMYARPGQNARRLDQPETGDLRRLLDWWSGLRNAGANACYLDVVGAADYGDPLAVAEILRDEFPPATVVEYAKDIYPTGFLVSGCLWGGWDWWVDLHKTPNRRYGGPDFSRGAFPRFGRYVLDDRVIFMGGSNGDHVFWGASRGYNYWGERQAFLLGCKLDGTDFVLLEPPDSNRMNRAVAMICDEWDRSRFWQRDPVYRDRDGLTGIPDGIDVRCFDTRDGESLLVIDNWGRLKNRSFQFHGHSVPVPERPLSILGARAK